MRHLDPRRLALMVVTSQASLERGHRAVAGAAIAGGATAIQLRAPDVPDERLVPLAVDIASSCRAAGVLFVVNDRAGVARAAGSDALHVGRADDQAGARGAVGSGVLLGMSVGTVDEAVEAEALGADYLGVTVWSTPTKPEAVPVGPEGLRAIAAGTPLPVVGIGGIGAENAAAVIGAGAVGVAVISEVASADDPVAATRRLRAVVEEALGRRVRAAG